MTPLMLDVIFYIFMFYTTIMGYKKGLIKGLADICALVIGIIAARAWGPLLMPYLGFIPEESWRTAAAYVLAFIVVLIAINIICNILEKLINLAFLGWLNKLAGAGLGLLKGLILVALIVLTIDMIAPGSRYVQELPGLPFYSFVLELLQQWLPESVTRHINFSIAG